jgi:hypothetical protein
MGLNTGASEFQGTEDRDGWDFQGGIWESGGQGTKAGSDLEAQGLFTEEAN